MIRIVIGKIFLLSRLKIWNWVYLGFRKKYELAKSFHFNGPGITFYGKGQIITGERSYIGRYSSIQSTQGFSVTIGSNVAISHYVMIYTESRLSNQDFSNNIINNVQGNVEIGDNTWIGAHVFIKQGIKIGKNCVIGANSVITKDIPDFTIVGGVPAKILGKIAENLKD